MMELQGGISLPMYQDEKGNLYFEGGCIISPETPDWVCTTCRKGWEKRAALDPGRIEELCRIARLARFEKLDSTGGYFEECPFWSDHHLFWVTLYEWPHVIGMPMALTAGGEATDVLLGTDGFDAVTRSERLTIHDGNIQAYLRFLLKLGKFDSNFVATKERATAILNGEDAGARTGIPDLLEAQRIENTYEVTFFRWAFWCHLMEKYRLTVREDGTAELEREVFGHLTEDPPGAERF